MFTKQGGILWLQLEKSQKRQTFPLLLFPKFFLTIPYFRASQETRERVLKTAEELHYQYTGKKSQLHIGCIMSLTYSYSDPYFNDILGGIQSYCASHNAFISLIVSYSQLHNMTPGLKKQLSELDGLIITEIPPETLEFITTLIKKSYLSTTILTDTAI